MLEQHLLQQEIYVTRKNFKMPKVNNNGPFYTRVEISTTPITTLVPANFVSDSPNNKQDVEIVNKNLNTVHGTSTIASGTNQWGPYFPTL